MKNNPFSRLNKEFETTILVYTMVEEIEEKCNVTGVGSYRYPHQGDLP